MRYLQERRKALGGYLPARIVTAPAIKPNLEPIFEEFYGGTGDRKVSTTMVFVKMLAKLLRDKDIGKLVVPIVPDEARTFGMESLFRAVGIYSHSGQLYEPVDMDTLLYYKEAKDGQILEEGITEAGSMSSFIAAGTAYATHGVNTIPFFIYYSMFGFQRIGDLIWAAGDSRCRGFLLGGTAGRTTLAGEGLQHQDGHSHVYSLAYPNCLSYDPAFAYELAVIIQDGIRRMYGEGESVFYYLTVMNEAYEMPAMPDGPGVREGIVKGLYKCAAAPSGKGKLRAQLLGQRRHPPGSAQGADDPQREVRRSRRRVERDELRRALSRGPRSRALEHAASGREAEGAVRHAALRGHRGPDRRRVRLPQGAAGPDRSLAAPAARVARHRRVRPQREPRGACVTTSRWTPASSRSPRWRRSHARARWTRRSCRRRSRTSTSTSEKRNPFVRIAASRNRRVEDLT